MLPALQVPLCNQEGIQEGDQKCSNCINWYMPPELAIHLPPQHLQIYSKWKKIKSE